MSLPLRENSCSLPPSTRAIARTPSHLNSYAHSSSDSLAGSPPGEASIGSTSSGSRANPAWRGGSERRTIQSFESLPLRKNVYRPFARSPSNTTATSRSDHFSVSQRPRAQMNILPPPYSPVAISPEDVDRKS